MIPSVLSIIPNLPMDGDGFSFKGLFDNAKESLMTIGGAFIGLVGLVMIVVAIFQIAKALISPNKGQANWVMTIALLLVGGIFVVGSLSVIVNIAQDMGSAVQGLGEGEVINQIVPFLFN